MNKIPTANDEGKSNSIAEKTLETLLARNRITQDDVREALSTMTRNDRMSLWILTQERMVSSSSEILSKAWQEHGIYSTVRVLLNSVLTYKTAPEVLQDAIYQLSKLKFIEKELAIFSGYKNIPPYRGSFGLGGHPWK